MQQKSSLRAVMTLLGVAVTIAAIVGLLYADRIGERRRYLVEQRVTALSETAAGLTESIASARAAIENAAGPACATGGALLDDCRWLQAGGSGTGDGVLPPGMQCATNGTPPTSGLTAGVLHSAVVPGTGSLVLDFTYPCPSAKSLHARFDVGAILRMLLESQGIRDNLLLATPEGEVIWRAYPALDPATNLLDLIVPGPSTGKSDPRRPEELVPGRIDTVAYGGERHELFVAPVHLTPRRLTGENGDTADAKDAPSTVLLCDMMSETQTRRAARAVPLVWLLPIVLAVLLTALGWPLLKLRYLGARERLRGGDVWLLVACGMLAVGIVTAGVLISAFHFRTTFTRDEQLRDVARDAGGRLRRELLHAWSMLRTVAVEGGRPAGRYHEYSDLFVVDARGIPTQRWVPVPRNEGAACLWHAEAFTPPQFSVKDRSYFSDVRERRYWSLGLRSDTPREPRGFTVEPVQSRLTTELTVVLATHVHHEPRASSDPPPAQTALIGIRPAAFTDPVLPPGLSVLAVDAEGTVKLHSITARSMRENVLVECEGNGTLAAALRTRRAQHVDATCYGGQRRLYVTPLVETPWSIVAIGDPSRLQTMKVEIVAVWVVLYGAYFVAFVTMVLIARGWNHQYRAPWLWPDRRFAERYLVAAGQLLVTALVTCVLVPRSGGVSAALLIVLAPIVTCAALCVTLGTATTTSERTVARAIVAAGALALVVVTAAAGDWLGVLLLVLTGLLWGAAAIGRVVGGATEPALGLGATAAIALTLLAGGERTDMTALAVGAVGSTGSLVPNAFRRWLGTTERGFRTAYTTMLWALLVVVAVVPATLFFRDAEEYAETAYVKHGQLELAHALVARAERIKKRSMAPNGDPELTALIRDERMQDTRDVYAGAWLRWPLPYTTRPAATAPLACELTPSRCPSSGGSADLLSLFVLPLLPSFDAVATDLRRAACDGATDRMWCWRRSAGDGPLSLRLHDRSARSTLGAGHHHTVASEPASGTRADDVVRWLGTLGLAGILLAVAAQLLGSIARRVFLLDIDAPPNDADEGDPTRRCVFLYTLRGPPAEDREGRSGVTSYDLTTADPTTLRTAAQRLAPRVELHHLEVVLHDRDRSAAALALVTALLTAGCRVTLSAEVDVFERCVGPSSGGEARTDLHAWAALSTRFAGRFVRLGGAPDSIGARLLPRYDDGAYDPALSDGQNDDALAARNRRIWTYCTPEQQLALRQLTDEGFLNPNNEPAERLLFGRGLVRRSPTFEVLDDSLRRFVLRVASPVEVAAWEHAETPSVLARMRTPLMLLAAVVCGFFFLTQRDTFDTAVGTVTAIVGSLPLLVRMVGMLGASKADASEKTIPA